MTRADAIPQGTYKLSPSDSIPSSEQAGTDVGWCGWVGGWVEARGGDTGKRSYKDRREKETETWAGNGGHVAERRNNGAKKRKNVGFLRKTRKTAKEIQSSLTFTVPDRLPKAAQSSGSWAVKEHGSPNTLSA